MLLQLKARTRTARIPSWRHFDRHYAEIQSATKGTGSTRNSFVLFVPFVAISVYASLWLKTQLAGELWERLQPANTTESPHAPSETPAALRSTTRRCLSHSHHASRAPAYPHSPTTADNYRPSNHSDTTSATRAPSRFPPAADETPSDP